MKAATALAKQLRQADFPDSHKRQLRAMHVAQALAYHCSIEGCDNLEAVREKYNPIIKKMVNDVNEFLPVDTRLVNELFDQMIASRLELLYGVKKPALLNMVLNSSALSDRVSDDFHTVVRSYTTQPNFGGIQQSVCEFMANALTVEAGDAA